MSSTSQSVARAFKLFEVFAKLQRPLASQELAALVGAPRSSAAALLKTLCDLGLLRIDRRTATYFPTARFAELGAWLADGVIYPPELLDGLKQLCAATGETVTLGTFNDLQIELVRVERSDQAISFTAEPGQKLPLWGSGVGTAYLSALQTPQIRSLYRRATKRRLLGPRAPALGQILSAVKSARSTGWAIAEGAVFPDASAISVPTSAAANTRTLVVSVVGPTIRMKPHFDTIGRKIVAVFGSHAPGEVAEAPKEEHDHPPMPGGGMGGLDM